MVRPRDNGVKKGPWTPEEDQKLVDHIGKHGGHGSWRVLPKLAGLNRCGKSCRLRWTNYLRPDIKRGNFSNEEEQIIIKLHSVLGNKWSAIATHLPGRTDNEVKNFWNTHLKKKLLLMGIDPTTHKPRPDLNLFRILPHLLAATNSSTNSWDTALRLQADVAQLARIQLLHNLVQAITGNAPPNLESNFIKPAACQNDQYIEYLQSNRQLEGFDGFLGLSNGPIQTLSKFSNSGIQLNDHQVLTDSCACFEGQETAAGINGYSLKTLDTDNGSSSNNNNYNNNNIASSYVVANANPTSTELLASLEQEPINPSDISTYSSTSTTFEAWGELNLDDQASEYYWGDIIEQTSPSCRMAS